MQKLFSSITGIFALMFISCASGTPGKGEADPASCLSKEIQNKVIVEYTNALNEFAQLSPVIGADSESSWAAQECDKMAQSIKKDVKGSFLKRMCGIYKMQAYCGYSMSYATSCWAMYENKDNTASMAMHSASVAGDLYDEIAKEDFSDFDKILKLAGYSFYYIQLHPHLYNELSINAGDPAPFSENGFGQSLQNVALTDSLAALNVPRERIFRIASVLESVSFFQAFCPLVQGFAHSEEKYNAQRPTVIEFATFCDSASQPVYSSFYKSPSETTAPEGKAFEEFMLKSLEYKTAMLRMLCENIRDIAEAQAKSN